MAPQAKPKAATKKRTARKSSAKKRSTKKRSTAKKRSRGMSAFEDARKRGEKMMKDAQQTVEKTRNAGQKRTAKLATNVVEFQKSTFDNAIDALGKLQKRSNKMISRVVKEASWMPGEGKEVVDDWVKMMEDARSDFKKTSDKSFDLVIKYLKRVEREVGKSPTKKKKAAAKRKSARKKTTKRKSTKKKPAKRKASTRRKSSAASKKPASSS